LTLTAQGRAKGHNMTYQQKIIKIIDAIKKIIRRKPDILGGLIAAKLNDKKIERPTGGPWTDVDCRQFMDNHKVQYNKPRADVDRSNRLTSILELKRRIKKGLIDGVEKQRALQTIQGLEAINNGNA